MNAQNGEIRLPSIGHDPSIRGLELLISAVLRVGVITSTTLIVVGSIVTFVQHPTYLSSPDELQRIVSPGAAFPHALNVLIAGLHQLRGEAIVTLGLLVLIATPMLRVLISALVFIHQRDRVYSFLTAAVLCLLLLSLLLGAIE